MLTHYRYFAAIVEHGGLTAAAQALGVSQPAITRSLQTLEFQLDAKLLNRATGKLELTPMGEMLLSRARVLLAEQRSMLSDLEALKTSGETVTYVNGSPMTAVSLLPRILARMHQMHPNFRVSVRGDNGANYKWKQQAVLNGEIDVAITIFEPELRHENVEQRVLFEPELKVVVSRKHPAASNDTRLADLMDYRWIFPPENTSTRAVVENEFRINGLNLPRNSIEISDWRLALEHLSVTECVTAIPYHPACFHDQFGEFFVFPITFTVRPIPITCVTRTLAMQRPGTQAFVEMATAVVREFSESGRK